jgi:hypothetical protein
MADIATVATGLQKDGGKKDNNVLALSALAAVTALDLVCANALGTEKGGRKTAIADYSDRTGFPGGLGAARGAARKTNAADAGAWRPARCPVRADGWADGNAQGDSNMALNAHHDPMTEKQRLEIKRLCGQANIPDKSGELLTRQGADSIIEELRRKAAEQDGSGRL